MRLIYDAPANYALLEDGQTIHGGEEFVVDDKRGAELVKRPDVCEATDSLERLTRGELNQLAREAGITEPEGLKSKRDVIDALNHQPAAAVGEGHQSESQED